MRSLLRRPRAAPTALLLTFLIIAFTTGYLIGTHRSLALSQCRDQNEMLVSDLTRAVARGVLLETNLILCKEKK